MIPTMILGGSDLAGGPPRRRIHADSQRDLAGYKGVAIRLEGSSLIRLLMERLQGSGALGPIHVAGPVRVYRREVPEERIVDTDGSFSENVSAAVSWLTRHFPGSPAAFTTCDILPDVADLDRLLSAYDRGKGQILWFPMIRAPADAGLLRASFWKPRYKVVDEGGLPVGVLPSHFLIADVECLRLRLIYRLLEIAYRTRNRPVGRRFVRMLLGALFSLIREDAAEFRHHRLPTVSLRAAVTGCKVAVKLRHGSVRASELEAFLAALGTRRDCVGKRGRGPLVELPILDGLSFALDVDTEEEALELGSSRP